MSVFRVSVSSWVLLGLLGLGCSEYNLESSEDLSEEGTDEDEPNDTLTPTSTTTSGDPAIALDATLELISSCSAEVEGVIVAESVGTRALSITEITLEDVTGAGLSFEEPTLPLVLEPEDSVSIPVFWDPGEAFEISAALLVVSDDPDQPSVWSGISGEVVQESTPPVISLDMPSCTIVPEDEAVRLSAMVSDDASVEDLWVSWTSDADGLLYEGPPSADGTTELEPTLSGGDHIITVTAEDTCGGVSSESFDISVLPYTSTYGRPGPDGLSFDAGGYLWVADWNTNRVYKVNPWTFDTLWSFVLPYSGADGLTLMGDTILVSFYYTNQVVFLDSCTGAELSSWPSPTTGGISDVSWDGTDLWVVDYIYQKIHRVDPGTGASLEVFDAPYSSSNGLTFDGTDFWLTANGVSNKVARLDTDFEVLEEFPHTGTDPRGIAWDGTYIWWSDATLGLIDILVEP